MLKGVIFDFNGTLFLDSEFHNSAWQEFAQRYGKTITPGDLDKHIHGFTNHEIIQFLFNSSLSRQETLPYSEEKEMIYRRICSENPELCILAPGAFNFFEFLRLKKIPKTIATASYKKNVEYYFEWFKLDTWFTFDSVVYDNGNYRGKPFPDMFLAAAKNLGLPATDCLIIEDSVGGINAAKAAGAGKIIAMDSMGPNSRYTAFDKVDQVIADFSEIDRNWLVAH